MIARAKRSLRATAEGIERANQAVLTYATKMELAQQLQISRATVQNFFARKAIGRENFHKICQQLELPWQEIAEVSNRSPSSTSSTSTASTQDIDSLVRQLRQLLSSSIEQRCGKMRVLDMSQPLELDEIYTNLNILEKINGRRRLEVSDLLQVCSSEEFDRPGLNRSSSKPVAGIEAVKKFAKLIILGKPGAGKTTFLKHVALQCNRGRLVGMRLPIFISLKDYAETEQQPGIVDYIQQQFNSNGINHNSAAEEILTAGRGLILLDGLDEVRESDCYRVLQQVRQLTLKYHRNHYLISCRLATREYTLEEFTEVEVADFSSAQIESFAAKWFGNSEHKSRKFITKLQSQPPIMELATNPLLLTLLCLIFEEAAEFPTNRSELYKEGLNVLLRKWDAKRNIERQQIYKKLSLPHKEDLLGQIARNTFSRGDYFFRQPEIEQQIADYLRHLPSVNPQQEALAVDAEAVLKSIEAQHGLLVERARGIYSFSHLTFQEYFTAREIVAASNPQALEASLLQLTSRISEPRWREVFLLSVEMLRNADYLLQLMQQQVQQLLSQEEKLQAFLGWVEHKAVAVCAAYKPVTVRAFYFDLDLARSLDVVGGSLDLARALNPSLTCSLDSNLALDLALDRTLTIERVLHSTASPSSLIRRVLERAIDRAKVVEPDLAIKLQKLRKQLPDLRENKKGFEKWWQANGQTWIEQLRAATISYRQLGHDWQFSDRQRHLLQQYHYANKLLVECLYSNCYATSKVRQEIEETLLLPSQRLSYSPSDITPSLVK